ncbi:hypothetical protein KM043_001867 [Ampulex compressa]|nr:hypothetical protein KM043_001867 [Ampulex compressa]
MSQLLRQKLSALSRSRVAQGEMQSQVDFVAAAWHLSRQEHNRPDNEVKRSFQPVEVLIRIHLVSSSFRRQATSDRLRIGRHASLLGKRVPLSKYSSISENRREVSRGYLEIYNDRVRDLLKPSTGGSGSRVREHPRLGPYVQGLTHRAVHTLDSLMSYVEEGTRARKTAATLQNPSSSRSHALLTIALLPESIGGGHPGSTSSSSKSNECSPRGGSKLHLVDLAGSESAATCSGVHRLKEGANINKSLVALGNVISALAERGSTGSAPGRRFIPYRDSSLTWLLKDALGGNATTIMLATISPASGSYNETAHTLRFAQRAQSVVNRPVVNENPVARIIRELRAEVARLKRLLLQKDIAPEPGCRCGAAKPLEDPLARQESARLPGGGPREDRGDEGGGGAREARRREIPSAGAIERFHSAESLSRLEGLGGGPRAFRRFGSYEFLGPKRRRLGYNRAEVSELNDDEEDRLEEIHESVFVDIPTLVAVLIKPQDGPEEGASRIEEICSDEVPEDADDVDLIEAAGRGFDERRGWIDAPRATPTEPEIEEDPRGSPSHARDASRARERGRFRKQDSIDAPSSIPASNLETSRKFGSVEAIQRKKEPIIGLERSHTSLEKRPALAADRGKKLNNIREIEDGRAVGREANGSGEQLQRKGSNDSDKSLKDSNGKVRAYARKPSSENLRRKTSKDSSSSSSREEQQTQRKSSLEQEPPLIRAHTPIQRAKRSEIVAAVTERLYSSRKHVEESPSQPSGFRSPPEGTEGRPGTSALAARSKLQELSRKMLAKRRRVCAETQTENERTVRVRDAASLTEDTRPELRDVGVLTEEHESCEALPERRAPLLRVKEIATLTDKPRTSIVRCKDVGSLATDLEDHYYEIHSPRNDSGILSDDAQNYAESNLSSAEASDLCPEPERRVVRTESSMNTILPAAARSCAVQTARQDVPGQRKAPAFGRAWCNSVQETCRILLPRVASQKLCARRCCASAEESCDNLEDRKAPICERRCCAGTEESCDPKTPICGRECCGRLEESCANVERRKASNRGGGCCARGEESCGSAEQGEPPICGGRCCSRVDRSCERSGQRKAPICAGQFCTKLQESYERREAPARARQCCAMLEGSCEDVKEEDSPIPGTDCCSVDERLAPRKTSDSVEARYVSKEELDRTESRSAERDLSVSKSSARGPVEEHCQNLSTLKPSNIPEKSVISISLPDMISITIESSGSLESRIAVVESVDLPAEKSTSDTRNSEAQTDRKEESGLETREKVYAEDLGRPTVAQADGKVFRIENIFEDPRSACRSCSKNGESCDSRDNAGARHSVTFRNSLGTSSHVLDAAESEAGSVDRPQESENGGSVRKEGSITEAFISKKRSASLSPGRQESTTRSSPWSSWTLARAMRSVRSVDHLPDPKVFGSASWPRREDRGSKQASSPRYSSESTRLDVDPRAEGTKESMSSFPTPASESCEILELDRDFSDDSLDLDEESTSKRRTPPKIKKIECTEARENLCPPDVVAHTKKENPAKAMDEEQIEVVRDFEDGQVEFPGKIPSCSSRNVQVHDYKSPILGTTLESIPNDDRDFDISTTCVENGKKKVSFFDSSGSNESPEERSSRGDSNPKHHSTSPVLKSIIKKKKKIRSTGKPQSRGSILDNETEDSLRENDSTLDSEFDYARNQKKTPLANESSSGPCKCLDSKEDPQTDESLQADNVKLTPDSGYPRTKRKTPTINAPDTSRKTSKGDLQTDESSRENDSNFGEEPVHRRSKRKSSSGSAPLGGSCETLVSKEDRDTDESSGELDLKSSNHREDLSSDECSEGEDSWVAEKRNVFEEYLDEALIFMRNMNSINEYMSATHALGKGLGRARRRRARRRSCLSLEGDYVEYKGRRVSLKDDTDKDGKREEDIDVPTESYERCIKGIRRLESCIRKVDRQNELLRERYGIDVESAGARFDLASPSTDLKAFTAVGRDSECAEEKRVSGGDGRISREFANSSIHSNRVEDLENLEKSEGGNRGDEEDSGEARLGGYPEDEVEKRIFDQLMSEVDGEEYRSSRNQRNVPGTRVAEIKSQSLAPSSKFRQRSAHAGSEFRQDVARIPNLYDNPSGKVRLGDIRDTPSIAGAPSGQERAANPSIVGRIALLRRTSAIRERDAWTGRDSRPIEDFPRSCEEAKSIGESDRLSSTKTFSPTGERITNDAALKGAEVNCPTDWPISRNSRWAGRGNNSESRGLGECTLARIGSPSKVETLDVGGSCLAERIVTGTRSMDEGTRLGDKLKYPGSPRAKFLELLTERRRIVESTRGTGAS